ncbi:MAG: hypothetical protein HY748_12085 [Elusimicrobia bacterium]|nr:hypothetical protein [Elusimicrobiota bacterium]
MPTVDTLSPSTRTTTSSSPKISLLPIAGILNEHLTEALCQQVFESVRTNERQREWSLFTLAKFWAAVTIAPPNSLGQALDQGRAGGSDLMPEVTATNDSSFQRFTSLRWKFFHALYYAFTQRLLGEALSEAGQGILRRGIVRMDVLGAQSDERGQPDQAGPPQRSSLWPHHAGRDPRAEAKQPSTAPLLCSRPATVEVSRSYQRWPEAHEINLGAMAFRTFPRSLAFWYASRRCCFSLPFMAIWRGLVLRYSLARK